MSLFCPVDLSPGVFVKHDPKPPLPRGVKWRPPDLERDRCARPECGRHAVDHWTVKP